MDCQQNVNNSDSSEQNESSLLLDGESNRGDTIKGLLFAALHMAGVAATSIAVPLLQRRIPDFELNAYRTGVSLVIVIIGLVVTKQLPWIPKCEISGQAVFCLVGFMSPMIGNTAVSMVPLSYYKSLLLSGNIIFGLILYSICANEKTDFKSVIFAVLCVAGVVCSIQPEFIFTWKNNLSNNTKGLETNYTLAISTSSYNSFNFTTIGCILSAFAGLFDVFEVLTLKKNPYLADNILKCLFWTLLVSVILSLSATFAFEKPVWPRNKMEIFLVGVHSISYSMVYFSMALSAKFISGNVFNVIYSTLVIIMLIPQYTLLKHILPGNRNWIEVFGTVLVFIGATAGSIWELAKKQSNKNNKETQ